MIQREKITARLLKHDDFLSDWHTPSRACHCRGQGNRYSWTETVGNVAFTSVHIICLFFPALKKRTVTLMLHKKLTGPSFGRRQIMARCPLATEGRAWGGKALTLVFSPESAMYMSSFTYCYRVFPQSAFNNRSDSVFSTPDFLANYGARDEGCAIGQILSVSVVR